MMIKRLVQLSGGFPWGFRLSQDHLGIRVQRVRPNSKAAVNGLFEGDIVTHINQFDCRFLTLREVNYLIDQCRDVLSLQIWRSDDAKSTTASTASYVGQRTAPGACSDAIWNANRLQDFVRQRVTTAVPRGLGNLSDYGASSVVDGPVRHSHPRPDKKQNAYRCTIEFVHSPASVKIGSPQPYLPSPALFRRRQPRSTPTNGLQLSKGYASDAETWHRSEFSLRPRASCTRQFFGQKRAVTANLYEQPEPVLSRQPKFHVMRRASAEPTVTSVSSRQNSATQTAVTNPPVIAAGGHGRRVRIPSEYEGELTDDQQKDVQKLGSSLKHKSRHAYSDSLFCRGALANYPTIEEQKRLAKRIAEILENVDTSHRVREYDTAVREDVPPPQAETRSAQTDLLTTTEEDTKEELADVSKLSGLPKCIEDSVRRISQDELLKSVASPPEFQVLHLQDHTTHTAVPPDVCMNFARQLKYGPGKGAELFQKRKARSEKWVVDSNRAARMPQRVAFSDTEMRSPTLPMPKRTTVSLRPTSKANYFNAVPKGWSGGASLWMSASPQAS